MKKNSPPRQNNQTRSRSNSSASNVASSSNAATVVPNPSLSLQSFQGKVKIEELIAKKLTNLEIFYEAIKDLAVPVSLTLAFCIANSFGPEIMTA